MCKDWTLFTTCNLHLCWDIPLPSVWNIALPPLKFHPVAQVLCFFCPDTYKITRIQEPQRTKRMKEVYHLPFGKFQFFGVLILNWNEMNMDETSMDRIDEGIFDHTCHLEALLRWCHLQTLGSKAKKFQITCFSVWVKFAAMANLIWGSWGLQLQYFRLNLPYDDILWFTLVC